MEAKPESLIGSLANNNPVDVMQGQQDAGATLVDNPNPNQGQDYVEPPHEVVNEDTHMESDPGARISADWDPVADEA